MIIRYIFVVDLQCLNDVATFFLCIIKTNVLLPHRYATFLDFGYPVCLLPEALNYLVLQSCDFEVILQMYLPH